MVEGTSNAKKHLLFLSLLKVIADGCFATMHRADCFDTDSLS